jgi:hypothetical protein
MGENTPPTDSLVQKYDLKVDRRMKWQIAAIPYAHAGYLPD